MSLNLSFLGAAGTVTGSKHLLKINEDNFLIDCGLFQGAKEWRQKNWDTFPGSPHQLRGVILTHVHLDHCGYLPRLVKQGFEGPIYCTRATAELLPLMLKDSAFLQEEEARYANFKGYAKHKPALPLYTAADVQATLPLVEIVPYGDEIFVNDHLNVRFHPNGHLLGSAWVECNVLMKGQKIKVFFSGDLGRYHDELMRPPIGMSGHADYVVLESTYGSRVHPTIEDAQGKLAEIITQTAQRGGVIMIPAFAIGRTAVILYYLRQLEQEKKIPILPVYVDSPMATDATEIYAQFGTEMNLQIDLKTHKKTRSPLQCEKLEFLRSPEESKQLNNLDRPAIIISASGMASGGRILHHFVRKLPDPKNTVLLVGYQAEGTRGWLLQHGASEIKIHGQPIPVRAQVALVDGFSAHGDQNDLLQWMGTLSSKPKMTFLVHGEQEGLNGIAEKLNERGFPTHIPGYRDNITLSNNHH